MQKYFNLFKANQLKRPSGLFGRFVAKSMQEFNLPTYNWMISKMDFNGCSNVLEIGYGTGKVLTYIAKNYPDVKIAGIDFSRVMFEKAYKNNKEFINSGKMNLAYGDILEYNSNINFDLIYGINVIYFWDELKKYFNKIYSLLSPKGKLYLYMTDSELLRKMPAANTEVFNKRSVEEVLAFMKECNFLEARCESGNFNSKKGHCLIAKK